MNLQAWLFISFGFSGVLGNNKIDFIRDFLINKNIKLNFVMCWDLDNTDERFIGINDIPDVNVVKLGPNRGPNTRLQIMTNHFSSYKPKQIRFLETVEDLMFDDYLIIDIDCEKAWKFVKQMDQLKRYSRVFRINQILLFVNKDFTELPINLKFLYSNNLIIAKETSQGFHLLKPPTDLNSDLQNYGNWSIISGVTLSTKSKRFCNFNGREFDIAMVLSDPSSVSHLENYRHPWIDTYTKQSYATLMRLFDYCNITPRLVPVRDFKHLYDKNSTFLLTASTPYLSREVINNVNVLYVQNGPKICYLMRRPPTSFMTTIFTDSLTDNVWWAMLATLGLLSTCYYFILNLEGRREKIKYQEKFTVFDLGLIAFEAVCQQGTTVDPKSYSARILAVIMFLAFMFLYVSYSANILILLQATTAIEDSKELHGLKIKYGGMDTHTFLQYNFSEDYGNMIYSIDNAPFYSISEGMEKLKYGFFAYYVESPYAYKYATEKYTDYDVCGLHEIGGYVDKKLGYINIPKNSPYVEILKISLLLMVELGFQSRDYQRYFYKPTCFSKGSSFDPVGLAETHQIMYLVVMGIVSSLAILGIEILGHRLVIIVKNRINMQRSIIREVDN